MLELNPANFENEVKKSKTPVLVDFWAPWCGPCKMLGPIYEKVSANYTGKIKFAKVNVDENQELAGEYGVMGIPTMVLFEKGKEKARVSGALSEDALKAWLEDNMD